MSPNRHLQTDRARARQIAEFDWSATPLGPREQWSDRLNALLLGIDGDAGASDGALAQRMLAFQLQLGDRLRPLSDPEAVKRLSAELLAGQLQVAQIGFAELDADGSSRTLSTFSDGRLPDLTGRRDAAGTAPTLFAEMVRGRAAVMHDVAGDTHPRATEIAELCAGLGIRALVTVPLLQHGRLVAYLFIAHDTPRRWAPHEVELAHDVATRTWAAVERAVTEAALRETRERLAATLEAAHIGTWDYDAGHDRLLPDSNLAAMLGLASGKTPVGMALEDFVMAAHKDDRDALRRSLADALTGAPPADGVWQSEHRLLQAGGEHRWAMARGRIERDRQGRAMRMPGVLVDITDRKGAEEALREADRRKDEYLATLAHELRNPLAPIRSAARVAADPSSSAAQQRWSHEVIERQVRTMALLLDDLLDVSRITRGILEVRREATTAAAIVAAALETAHPVIVGRGHVLQVDAAAEPVALHADPLRVAQALSNVLTNAAKYTDPGGRIALSTAAEDGLLVMRVRDTGIGIPAQALRRIFGMFSQVESALDRSEGGLGIGLALVKGIVELHGGSVSAHSAGLGQGSEFVLKIPLQPKEDGGPQAPDAPPADNAVGTAAPVAPQEIAPSDTAAGAALRIALADDNVDAAETLAALLGLDGYDVCIANDGLAALELVERYAPDAVFLDIGMPGLNGYEVAQELRSRAAASHAGRRMLLVALTGWGGEDDKKRALAAGFDHHLTKPVDPDALVELLHTLERGEI